MVGVGSGMSTISPGRSLRGGNGKLTVGGMAGMVRSLDTEE